MRLFRPVGLAELQLIAQSGMRRFPPRLPEQPIFYPVLNRGYAQQIARDWNTKSEPFAGFVTEFEVDDGYVQRFDVQQVGGREHLELWVPSEELARFNDHLRGGIRVTDAFYGERYRGMRRLDELLQPRRQS